MQWFEAKCGVCLLPEISDGHIFILSNAGEKPSNICFCSGESTCGDIPVIHLPSRRGKSSCILEKTSLAVPAEVSNVLCVIRLLLDTKYNNLPRNKHGISKWSHTLSKKALPILNP